MTAVPLRSSVAPAATLTAPLPAPRALAWPSLRVPSEMIVPPEWLLAPASSHVPAPFLIRLVVSELGLASTAVRALSPTWPPVRMSVRGPEPLLTMSPGLVKVSAPLPEASSVPPFGPRVNRRSVLCAAPV